MNPQYIAEIVKREIAKAYRQMAEQTFYRGIVTAISGGKCNVKLEGSAGSIPNILCISGYTPQVGDQVLVISIGSTGANFLALGRLNADDNETGFVTGDVKSSMRATAPTGWLLLDASYVDISDYPSLYDVIQNLAGDGNTTKTFTADNTTETFTSSGHGLNNGDMLYVKSSGTLPAGLTALQRYYVINKTTNTFQLSGELDGDVVPITTNGSGTHTAYLNFKLPEGRGRVLVGLNSSDGDLDVLAALYGAKTHTLSTAEMPAHNHGMGSINRIANVGNVQNGAGNLDDWPGSGGPISAFNAVVGNSWTGSMSNAGSGGAHNNMQPSLVVNHFIKT